MNSTVRCSIFDCLIIFLNPRTSLRLRTPSCISSTGRRTGTLAGNIKQMLWVPVRTTEQVPRFLELTFCCKIFPDPNPRAAAPHQEDAGSLLIIMIFSCRGYSLFFLSTLSWLFSSCRRYRMLLRPWPPFRLLPRARLRSLRPRRRMM